MTRNPPNSANEQSARSRYPGTRPFSDSADDCARFFGRTEEGEQLYLRVLSVPLVVQFGKSGLGKTSLLLASLFPRLRQKPFLPVMVRLNVADETLTLAVAGSIQQACQKEGLELTQGRRDGLWELLSTTTVWRDDLLLTPVLVFDQFEEVFTLRDAAFRADLAAELGALASGIAPERLRSGRASIPEQFATRPDVKIVISLREDYLGALQEFSAAIPSLFHERLRLEPLTEDAARKAITGPAQLMAGAGEEPYWAPRFDFEPPALDSMIAFLKGKSDVIEPFQLQLLCRHAEAIVCAKRSTQTDLIKLAPADFNGSKGFDSVLKNFYRDTLLKLDRSQRRTAETLCEVGLLGTSGHRLMLEERQIHSEFGITPGALATLSQERLLRRERRLESAFYEISHDRLAESILQSKRFRLPKKWRPALWTASIVAPVIVVGLLLWALSLDGALKDAELQRQKANAARVSAVTEQKNSERTLTFLLGEKFLGEIRDTGRSTMREQVREQAKRYEAAGDQRSPLLRGLALRNAGDVKRTQGALRDSVAFFREALKAIETNPDHPDSLREAARTHERLGYALRDQGQSTLALSHFDAAVKAWRSVASSPNDPTMPTDDCTSLADSLVSTGDLRNRMGDANRALGDIQEALKVASAVLFGRLASDEECRQVASRAEPYPDAKALEVLSRAVVSRASVLSFKEDYDGTAALAMEARRLRPSSVLARWNSLVALVGRGDVRVFETPQAALVDYRNVLAEFQELRHWDPNNRLWQRELAIIQLRVAGWIVNCYESKATNCKPMPSLEEAEATSLEAIATLRALAEIDLSNVSLQNDLGSAWQTHASVLVGKGRGPERLVALDKAEQTYRNFKFDDKDADGASTRGVLLRDRASALEALGRHAEATATLQRSIDVFKGLIADHQDNPTYVNDLSTARQREAQILRKTGDTTGANAADREVARLNEQYVKITGTNADEASKLDAMHTTHVIAGRKLFIGGDYAAALDEFKAAKSSMRAYIIFRPADFHGYDNLRKIYNWTEDTHEKLGNVEARGHALVVSMRAAQMAALLESEDSARPMQVKLQVARQQLGIFLNDNGRFDEALAMVEEEVVVAEALVHGAEKNPHDVRYAVYLRALGNAKSGLGMVRRNHEKEAGWEEAIRSGLIHIQKAAEIDIKSADYLKEVGLWRKYLADELVVDGRKEEASVEYHSALVAYRKALKTYQKSASITPNKKEAEKEVEDAIRELDERGVR